MRRNNGRMLIILYLMGFVWLILLFLLVGGELVLVWYYHILDLMYISKWTTRLFISRWGLVNKDRRYFICMLFICKHYQIVGWEWARVVFSLVWCLWLVWLKSNRLSILDELGVAITNFDLVSLNLFYKYKFVSLFVD